MEDMTFYEYTVAQKGGKTRAKRALLIFFYIVYVVAALLLGFWAKLVVPLLAFVPIGLWVIVFLTWKYTRVEYEYSISSGTFCLSTVFAERERLEMLTFRIKDCSLIAPLDDTYSERAREYDAQRVFWALPNKNSPNAYFATFMLGEKRCILYFEATDRALKVLRYYNSSATVIVPTSK